jgi:hypothetical protein
MLELSLVGPILYIFAGPENFPIGLEIEERVREK